MTVPGDSPNIEWKMGATPTSTLKKSRGTAAVEIIREIIYPWPPIDNTDRKTLSVSKIGNAISSNAEGGIVGSSPFASLSNLR